MLHAKQAQRGGRNISLLIIISGTRRGLVVSAMPQRLYLQEGDPVFIVQEAGWALGPVWMGVENQQHVGQPKLQHNVGKYIL